MPLGDKIGTDKWRASVYECVRFCRYRVSSELSLGENRVELNRYAVWGGASSPVGLDTSRAAPPLHISLSPSVARSLARAWTGCLQHIPCRKGAFHDTASQTDD